MCVNGNLESGHQKSGGNSSSTTTTSVVISHRIVLFNTGIHICDLRSVPLEHFFPLSRASIPNEKVMSYRIINGQGPFLEVRCLGRLSVLISSAGLGSLPRPPPFFCFYLRNSANESTQKKISLIFQRNRTQNVLCHVKIIASNFIMIQWC